MSNVIKSLIILLVVLGLGEDGMATSYWGSVRVQFFEYPIPNKVYEDSQSIVSRSPDPRSFFMAKVQIIGSPFGEKGNNTVLIKVYEVLKGKVHAEKFNVHFLKGGPYEGLPQSHAEGNFYFIMGVAFEDGNIHLLAATVQELMDSGYPAFSN